MFLVAMFEAFVVRHDLDFSNATIANWRHAGQAARRRVRGEHVLCFGTSLTNNGILPRVVEERLGKPTENLAVFGGPIPASYYLLRKALASGRRPVAVLLDSQDGPVDRDRAGDRSQTLWQHVREWPEILDLRDCLELSWSSRDAGFLGELLMSRLLPSYRARFEIRDNFRAGLQGKSGSSFFTIVTVRRNWRINRGAHVVTAEPPTDDAPAGPVRQDMLVRPRAPIHPRWAHDRICRLYTRRFLELAARHEIPVFWLMPPLGPRLQSLRDATGHSEYLDQVARAVQGRFPNVTVVDGRAARYPRQAFWDDIHLNRRGATTYSAGVASVLRVRLASRSEVSRWVPLPLYRDEVAGVLIEDLDESRAAVLSAASKQGRIRK
jgi:hypothetical protein